MGNIVGKQFKVVASKNLKDSLADSVKEGNQAKFYLAQNNNPNEQKALENVTTVTNDDRNVLIINGNTIQGISKNDISKLDAISDATKIFKYKGSLATKEALLAKIPPSVEVGDVYNVEFEITLNNIPYPAYTNFVYIGGHENTELNWDSLGGTMQIGVPVAPIVEYSILTYKTENNIPISSFKIVLNSDTGLATDDGGAIRLNLTSAYFTELSSNTLYINNNGAPLESVSLGINLYNGLCINNDCLDLKLSTATIIKASDNRLIAKSSDSPMNAFYILCKDGIHVNDGDAHSAPSLGLKLSSTAFNDPAKAKESRGSGLDITAGNELFLALATGSIDNSNYAVNALKKLNTDTSKNINGGLVLDGSALIDWLKLNRTFQAYINSLIHAKLQAQ